MTCNSKAPSRLDVFTAAVKDGRGNCLHRKLFVVQAGMDGAMTVREPTIFLDLVLRRKGTEVPCGDGLPDRQAAELVLVEKALDPLLAQVAAERLRETETISRHLELSLNTLIDRQNFRMAALFEQSQTNPTLFEANKKQIEDRLDELNGRLGAPPRRVAAGTPMHHRRHPAPWPGLGLAAPRAHLAGLRADGPRRRD